MTLATFFIWLGCFFLLMTGITLYLSYRFARNRYLTLATNSNWAVERQATDSCHDDTMQLVASCLAQEMLAKGLVRRRRRRTGYFKQVKRNHEA